MAKVMLDEKEYDTDDLTDEAKAQLASFQFVENELSLNIVLIYLQLNMKPVIDRPEPTRVATVLLRLWVWRAWYLCYEFNFGTVGKSYDRRCS